MRLWITTIWVISGHWLCGRFWFACPSAYHGVGGRCVNACCITVAGDPRWHSMHWRLRWHPDHSRTKDPWMQSINSFIFEVCLNLWEKVIILSSETRLIENQSHDQYVNINRIFSHHDHHNSSVGELFRNIVNVISITFWVTIQLEMWIIFIRVYKQQSWGIEGL